MVLASVSDENHINTSDLFYFYLLLCEIFHQSQNVLHGFTLCFLFLVLTSLKEGGGDVTQMQVVQQKRGGGVGGGGGEI